MSWVIFALLSRASWGVDNIIDKLLREKYLPDSLVLTLIAGIAPLLVSFSIVLLNGLSWIGLGPFLLITLAGLLHLPATFAFYQAVSKEEISRVIPLFQFTPVFVLILSFLFLGEVLTFNSYIAFVLILLGGLLISLKRIGGLFRLREAFWWMVLSSSIWAVYAVILKSLYVDHSFWDLTAFLGFGEFIPTLVIISVFATVRNRFSKGLSNLKLEGWMLLVLGMFFIALASLSGLWALTTAPVSLHSVFRGFQSVFVLIYAVVLSVWLPKILKEEIGKGVLALKITSITLMLIGLYLISL